MFFEVCVETVEGALAAQAGGAQRIELCSALALGGLTPSLGLVGEVVQHVDIDSWILIRPRGGDFCYTSSEISVMEADLWALKDTGIQGFVLGALLPDGSLDLDALQTLASAAHPYPLAFHRAFDQCADRSVALEQLVDLGFRRILTSGGAATAWQGRHEIQLLVQQAQGRIALMPGGGITPENILAIVLDSQAQEFHFSARVATHSPMLYQNPAVQMGSADDPYTRFVTDPERVRAIIANAH